MKKRSRNILIIVGIVLTIFVGLFGYGVWRIYSFFSQISSLVNKEIPAELQETKVFKGEEFLQKSEFFKLKKLPYSEIIAKSIAISDEKERQKFIAFETSKSYFGFDDIKICNGEIITIGKFGGYAFDENRELKREFLFEPSERTTKIGWYEQKEYKTDLDNLKIIELDNQGRCGFLSYGYQEGATVYDSHGKKLWNYGEEKVFDLGKTSEEDFDKKVSVLEAAVGDLDNDGAAEFIVARKNDGIHTFDQNGNEKWFQPDEFPSNKLTVIDIDGDGKNELLEVGSSSKIRDATGKIIKEFKGGNSGKVILFTEDKNEKKSLIFCQVSQNKLICEDEAGKKIIEGDAPLSDIPKKNPKRIEVPGHPEMSYTSDSDNTAFEKIIWVKLQKDKPKYLAVVASFISIPRAHFYVYDEKGNLIYHELLPEDAETIAVLPTANLAEEILIGGKETIWKFAVK